jgi:hypothetical protein
VVFGHRREAWVFLKGRDAGSAFGATVELVERRDRRVAGPKGAGGPYAWATFPETPYGVYTVRVTYPSGQEQRGRLVVDATSHSITLEQPATG